MKLSTSILFSLLLVSSFSLKGEHLGPVFKKPEIHTYNHHASPEVRRILIVFEAFVSYLQKHTKYYAIPEIFSAKKDTYCTKKES